MRRPASSYASCIWPL
ncbi:EAST1 family heat-stable enterotoxin [Salmonella enterica]|nr:EAST1 family heat-stable enterotoxin [Salmonella enterica]EEJ8659171.1 EAST1 family heat-stable enterotoxin [Salmonella enterica subsp. enterica]